MIFRDSQSLKQHLKKDAAEVALNPVRFINVDSMVAWIEVKKLLLGMADEILPLSKFCDGKDTTPNINRLNSVLKNASTSQMVVPLSEYLRIVPDQAYSAIQKIIKADYLYNSTGKLRIYLLMYRMKSLLKTLPTDDPRTRECVSFYETEEESDYRLTIIQKDIDVSLPGNEIIGFKSYLEYWEANPDQPLILHTENAIHFEKNHFFDDVRVIVSSYDLLKYQFDLPVSLYESLGTDSNWNELVRIIIQEGSFESACQAILSINKYSVSLFEKWSSLDSFKKWILWLWTRLQPEKDYVSACAVACDSINGFIDELYCRIISLHLDTNFVQLYEERKTILSHIHTVPTDCFWDEIQKIDKSKSLAFLTCSTDIEKHAIFDIISNTGNDDRDSVISLLKIVYPQLYYYLQNDEMPNSADLSPLHEQYFKEYKWLKATDTITKDFIERVRNIALEKGASVFEMQPRNYYVNAHYDDQTSILFVDGMGIEYVDYLAHLFSGLDEQQYSVTIEAGFCTLPSITEINKDFMNGRHIIEPLVRELDEIKHANHAHPESLIKQLDILDSLKNRILGLLSAGTMHRIIITADHGTSRMAVKVRNTEFDNVLPKPDNTEIYRYGRFCKGIQDDPQNPTAISINDYLVFADYSRFIQNGAPMDEIHGGASLEEWIVPIITIERFAEGKPAPVVITPQQTNYKPELGTKKVRVIFSISGAQRSSVKAKINGQVYKCEWDNGTYSFVFVPSKTDTLLSVKVIDGGILGQFNIQVEQGIKKNANFDI